MSWVYSRLNEADQQYAEFLHQRGYQVRRSLKNFKHFTFSNFQITRLAQPIKSGDSYMKLSVEPIKVLVSFFIDKAAEDFIVGLFRNQTVSIYDNTYRASFNIERIESLPNEDFSSERVTFQTLSPIVVARKKADGKDNYLSPEDPDFAAYFAYNLLEKYSSVHPDAMKVDVETAARLVKFRLLKKDKLKSRLLTIKQDKASETKVRAFTNFSFEVLAPADVLEVGFLGGFGKHSANGLGCCEVIVS
ncbi:hypothetical protein GCM10011514_50020 [Emticicia aquatilis]|uniref:CRISPR associated protein Cas6 C-terminal domain-containing protein n=2 Tax=Emticicia aquatilis TaxID=1537369 RepID=A0A917DY56_9BACT|nr:hypothetical protein GCM10011514_50020 [Emticicia aquatilis]